MLAPLRITPNVLISFSLSLLLSLHGYRRKSLSPSGALTAFFVANLTLSGGTSAFGVGLLTLYFIGSRATKYGKARKRALEDDYHDEGYRSGWQVLSNGIWGWVCADYWNTVFWWERGAIQAFGPDFRKDLVTGALQISIPFLPPATWKVPGPFPDPNSTWCPTEPTFSSGLSRFLLYAALGHFACCLGDTLASELGILSSSPPRLITSFRPVPPGTNGGISLGGTLASILGGLLVGLFMGGTLVIENSACRSDGAWIGLMGSMLFWGAVGGGMGSMVDSFLGATIQQTKYDESKKMVTYSEASEKKETKIVSGINILTNNQVNVLSSLIMSLMVGYLA
jgi:uncharacterized membrane protein